VRYRTRDDSAIAGQHYTSKASLLEFAPFQTEAVVRIALRQDEVFRGRPRFFLELHDPSPAARLDHPRPIVIHDRARGLIPGGWVNRLDGGTELEFDVAGLAWGQPYEIESSADLRQWTAEGFRRHLGPTKGSWWITYKSAPESIGIPNPSPHKFFRLIVP